MTEHEKAFKIYGKVFIKENGQGIPNVIVEALDKDLIFDDRLGSVITNKDGGFQILYDLEDFKELFFDLKPDIYLRVRKSDGTIIHTTEKKVRYEAGKTEAFHISISKSLIGEEEMKRENWADYTITGKVNLDGLKEISTDVPIVAYGIRDRRVIGHGPVKEDGSFEIHYNYKVFGENKEPYGVDLVIGPELPGDQILKTKLERKFLSAKGFKSASPDWQYEISETIRLRDEWYRDFDRIRDYIRWEFTYSGFVYTCSPLNIPPGGQDGCVDQEALSCPGGDVEAYVRLSRGSRIIAEDIEIDITGHFETTTHCSGLHCLLEIIGPVTVEVYQKTDTGEHTIYTGDHTFLHNIAQDIFIDRDETEIICTPPAPTPGTANFFGFERVGNIPVEAIYQEGEVTGEFGAGIPVPDAFVGYVNSVDKPGIILGDADKKLKDYAFFNVLHFYGNIGEDFGTPYSGGVDMSDVSIKYFRIKYSYVNPETDEVIGDTYISVPFNNTRKTTGGTTTESMKVTTHPATGDPLDIPTYIYPNPYETDINKDWKYRGLMLVFNTNTLPRKYGRYTFTIEPLDASMNPVTIADSDDCVLSLLIDNDHGALTGEIEKISRKDGTDWVDTGVCGVVDLTESGITSTIKIKYNLNHNHGNLRDYKLLAKYGRDKSLKLIENTYSRSGTDPYWGKAGDNVDEAVEKSHEWQTCSYEFWLGARRRVTNGFTRKWWEEFTYHVMINSNNPYTP